MNTSAPLTRRTVLTASAAGVGAIALAACSSGSSTSSAPAPDATTTGASTGANSASATAGGPAASSAAGGSSGGSPLVTLDSIAVGTSASVKLPDGKPGIVARPTADSTVAFSAICTHMGCTVNPAGKELHCPCHGSKYNAFTGAVIQGPAPRPLPRVDVHVAGGEVLSGA